MAEETTPMGYVWERFEVHCQYCGRSGELALWSGPQQTWGFKADGFSGLAVNRFHPENSLMRCHACGSSVVALNVALQQQIVEQKSA